MAKKSLRNPNSIEDAVFVDTRCIGCRVCEYLAPDIFKLKEGKSFVFQTTTPQNIETAYLAITACPVDAIGVTTHKNALRSFTKTLPILIQDNIYFCAFNDEKSFGANSYFIQRKQGNILVDVPRFDPRLVHNLEAMGGIAYIYLTHKDDIGAYAQFKAHFNAKVIFHVDDFNSAICEADIALTGVEPFRLDEEVYIIPQPGHTKGHTVMIYKEIYLFSGDHIAFGPKRDALYAFKNYCWYDWPTQVASLHTLANYPFNYILPGHGGRFMKEGIEKYLDSFLKELS